MTDDGRTLEAWVELASPYAYLSAMRVEALVARAGLTLVWRPFLLGPVFQALHGSADSPFNRNVPRREHMWRDVERRCRDRGLPFRRPSTFPRGSLLATQVALVGEGDPWVGPFVRRVFVANFGEDADIGAPEVVRSLLEEVGAPVDALLSAAASPDTKERLRQRTAEALARGVFGAPTFFAGGAQFWGDDRLEDALGLQTFAGLGVEDARAFAAAWLPAWTGNDPERLVSFYADDAVYVDPAVPQGLRGRAALLAYFRKLLRRNPAWVWTQREAIPMEHGFVNLWRARIPTGADPVELEGVCLVELRGGRIVRNEVYFDRSGAGLG